MKYPSESVVADGSFESLIPSLSKSRKTVMIDKGLADLRSKGEKI